jgi:hypothetical protein
VGGDSDQDPGLRAQPALVLTAYRHADEKGELRREFTTAATDIAN